MRTTKYRPIPALEKAMAGVALTLLPLTTGLAADPAPAVSTEAPNIVFILIDDLGAKDLGCTGSTYYETPNVDKLASQGMLFTDAYSAAPNCAPSRASILTGMSGTRHGVYTVGDANRGPITSQKLIPIPNTEVLDPKWQTIANVLDSAGYTTASIGKWHLGNDPATGPISHGFNINIGGTSAGQPNSYFSPYKMEHLTDGPPGEYLTDRLTDEAIKFIDDNKQHPFFLYMPHYAVHVPLTAKPELIAKYKAKTPSHGQTNPVYAAMIDSMDQSVGRIMAELDKLDLSKNTLVIFTSDNGGMFPITSNEPLRGCKGMLYEGGIRVPFIARWPGKIASGSQCHEPVVGLDLLPTFTEVARANLPSKQPVDGTSLVPLFEGGSKLAREALFWHFPCYLPGQGIGHGLRMTPATSMRMGDWTMLEFFEDNHLEMYNLESDLGEKENVATTNSKQADVLHNRMLAWRKSVNAPIPTELNPKYDPNAPLPKKSGGE